MKTYIKGIKTVAVIFLSLALFSCQEEQIEPQDTLSRTTDEILSEKGKPIKDNTTNNIEYNVTLTWPFSSTLPDVLVTGVNCTASNSTTQDLVYFNCNTEFTTANYNYEGDVTLTLNSIRLGGALKDPEHFRVIMSDGVGNKYFADFTYESIKPFSSEGGSWDFSELGDIPVNLKDGHGKNVAYVPSGSIRIGIITLTPQ